MENADQIVARQYEAWVYPEPITDMVEAIKNGYYDFTDIPYFGQIYWPQRSEFTGLKILIAGCGTNQAAYHAIRNPGCEVVGIDISMNSLGHSQYLKEKHGLHNLRLHQLDLEQVETLGEQFDLIISTGVLHHLRDPDAGLRALRNVLKPDGVMSLMLYGKTVRQGVYLLQEAFSLMGLGQEKSDVEAVRRVLAGLPVNHSVRSYVSAVRELKYDTEIVDTFLHRQDRAYSVMELYEFVESAGLAFVDWLDRLPYSVPANFPPGHPVRQRASAMNEKEQAAVVDLLTYTRGTHRFVVCHQAHHASRPRFEFKSNEFLNYKPKPRHGLAVVQMSDPDRKLDLIIKRELNELSFLHASALLLVKCDGKTTIEEMIQQLEKLGRSRPEWIELARATFAQLYENGHVLFSV